MAWSSALDRNGIRDVRHSFILSSFRCESEWFTSCALCIRSKFCGQIFPFSSLDYRSDAHGCQVSKESEGFLTRAKTRWHVMRDSPNIGESAVSPFRPRVSERELSSWRA